MRGVKRFFNAAPPGPDVFAGADLLFLRRSDSGLSVSGGVVDAWTGTGPSASASGGARPTDVATAPHLDDYRLADWDGINDSMTVASDINASANSLLVYVVINPRLATTQIQAIFDAYDGGSNRVAIMQGSGSGSGNVAVYDGTAWREIAAGKVGPQILVLDLRAGTGTAKAYRDFVQIGAAFDFVARTLQVGGGAIKIGSHFDGTSWPLNAQIAEIGIIKNPSDAYLAALNAYLAHRYPMTFQSKVKAVEAFSHVKALFLADRGLGTTSAVGSWYPAKSGVAPFGQVGSSRPTLEPAGFGAARPTLLFDGTDDYMYAGALSEWMTAADGYVYVLFEPITFAVADPGAGAYYLADPVWHSEGGYCGIGFYQSTNVVAFSYDSNYDERTAATTAARQIVRWRHTGGNLYLRINSDAESAGVASGNIGNITLSNRIGANPGATGNYAHMRVAAIVAGNDGALSSGDDAAIMAMLNAY